MGVGKKRLSIKRKEVSKGLKKYRSYSRHLGFQWTWRLESKQSHAELNYTAGLRTFPCNHKFIWMRTSMVCMRMSLFLNVALGLAVWQKVCLKSHLQSCHSQDVKLESSTSGVKGQVSSCFVLWIHRLTLSQVVNGKTSPNQQLYFTCCLEMSQLPRL